MLSLHLDVEKYPNAYNYERGKCLGASANANCVIYGLRRLGISRKKSLKHPKSDAIKRADFLSVIKTYEQEGRPIIYLDESGFQEDMPRTHGYSKIGQHCYGTYDWGSKKRTNVVGALLGTVLLTATLYTENMNADRFYQCSG